MHTGTFNKILTAARKNHNKAIKYTEKALAATDQRKKELYTSYAAGYFKQAHNYNDMAMREVKERCENDI